VGYQAGYSNTTGTNLTAVGFQAGYQNTTGYGNSYFGISAGYNVTTGASNTYIGNSTGPNSGNSSTGSYNTGVGQQALQSLTSASNNTAVGFQSLYSQTTGGAENTAVGYQAGYANTGQTLCAIGSGAAYNNTTGADNTAIGAYRPLYSNTTGSYNVAIGRQSLYSNTTASNNTAVGYQAGYTGSTTSNSCYFGYQAGYSANYNGAAYNAMVGRQAGYNTTGIQNNFFGDAAGYLVTTGSQNTILGGFSGNSANLDIRTASNYVVLSDGAGFPKVIVDNNNSLLVLSSSATSTGTSYTAGAVIIGNYTTTNGTRAKPIFWNNFYNTGASAVGTPQFVGNWTSTANWGIGSDTAATDNTVRIGQAIVDSNGWYWNGTYSNVKAGTYTNASDYRIKKIVATYTESVLQLIDKARPVSYNVIQNDSEGKEIDTPQEIGFIAHELQDLFPTFVYGEKDAMDAAGVIHAQSVDYAKLTSVCFKAIQELNATITDLQAKLKSAGVAGF
jgi:hypothetical protein